MLCWLAFFPITFLFSLFLHVFIRLSDWLLWRFVDNSCSHSLNIKLYQHYWWNLKHIDCISFVTFGIVIINIVRYVAPIVLMVVCPLLIILFSSLYVGSFVIDCYYYWRDDFNTRSSLILRTFWPISDWRLVSLILLRSLSRTRNSTPTLAVQLLTTFFISYSFSLFLFSFV